MPDQPTAAELAHRLGQFRDDVRGDFAEIRGDIGSLRSEVATRVMIDGLERAWHLRLSALEQQIHGWREAVTEADARTQKRLDQIEHARTAELARVEAKLEAFDSGYDRDRSDDAKERAAAEQAEKDRKQRLTLAVVGLVVTQMVTITVSLVAIINGRAG